MSIFALLFSTSWSSTLIWSSKLKGLIYFACFQNDCSYFTVIIRPHPIITRVTIVTVFFIMAPSRITFLNGCAWHWFFLANLLFYLIFHSFYIQQSSSKSKSQSENLQNAVVFTTPINNKVLNSFLRQLF